MNSAPVEFYSLKVATNEPIPRYAGEGRVCFPTYGKFQVGRLEEYQDDDPFHYTLEGAGRHAQRLSNNEAKWEFYAPAFGVWDEKNNVVMIYYLGAMYQ